ncbi:hypothetical protein [Sciscionella marina]|uniref:hypothetical protein n=1 Tax=Sciscionella marina TaxID=508770 RepID=UPI000476615F|nr:hypothetical protein [Sciscionella marina]
MTDTVGRGGHDGGAWSVDLLSDLHAGVLDEGTAAELWPKANADPQARAILEALESTRGTLSVFAEAPPAEPMPDDVAARLDAVIGQELAQRASPADTGRGKVVDLAEARRKRNKRVGWISGVVAAAAAVAAIAAVGVTNLGGNTEQGKPVAEGPVKPGVLHLGREELGKRGLSAALGARDYGPLEKPERLAGCLAANKAGSPSSVAGIKQLELDGKPGVLILLTTGKSAQFRMLVVSPECGAGKPETMSNSVIGSSVPVPPTR